MDGVLCDYDAWLDYNHARKDNGKSDWKKLEQIGSIYWARMPWLLEGHKLYNMILDYIKDKPTIELGISSAIFLKCGKIGKMYWIEHNCPDIPLKNVKIADKGIEKFKNGNKNEILIDDNLENVNLYKEVGYAIHYKNAKQAFDELKQLLGEIGYDNT